MFNFKYIKDAAAPGSWRRGYEYYRTNQILDINLSGDIVEAFVKGNFQDKYTVNLKLSPEKVSAQCDCPLTEEWCKHSVCVGLTSINKHLWEEYMTGQTGQQFTFEDENPPHVENPQGSYKVLFDTVSRKGFAGIQLIDREKNEPVSDVSVVLRAVAALNSANGGEFQLNNFQKYELLLMQNLYKNAKPDKQSGWYYLYLNKLEETLKILSQLEEVIDNQTKSIIRFNKEPLELILAVNVSLVGNVLLSLHWKRENPEDMYPLDEINYYSKNVKWGRYKNVIFPLDTSLSSLPFHLTKSTFTDIRDADGGKFVYEELPKLKKLLRVDISETLEKLTLEKRPPANVLILDADESGEELSLKLTLEFEYDGVRVPYGKLAEKTPYVTVKKPEEELLYWVKRNLEHEEKVYKFLINNNFQPMQTNNLATDESSAIDFYNKVLPLLKEGWIVESANDLKILKSAKNQLKIHADIDFDKTPDSFNLEISCKVGKTVIDMEKVQYFLQRGKKYFYLEKEGYVEIPLAQILTFTKSLTFFDAEKTDENKFKVKTYRAGLVSELMEQGAVLKMSKKFKKFWDAISSFSSIDEIDVPSEITGELREYQKKGLNWLWFLYSYGLNGILADDMGLGKTLQALGLIQRAKNEQGKTPTLVICPTSVVFNWENEVEKFAPELSCLNLTGNARKDYFHRIEKSDIVLTSYALLRRDIEELKKYKFRLIILDESQNIKNYDSLTAKCAKQLNSYAKLALSGTPIENRLSELWSVFDFLMPGFLYDINEFNYRFTVPIEERGDKTAEARLRRQVYPFILRRLKRDIAKDLPDKVESIAYCHMTPEQKEFYLDYLESTRNEIFGQVAQKGFEKSKMSIFAALLRLRQICNHPRLFDKAAEQNIDESGKFEHLKEMLEDIISEGHRVLLFSQFVKMLEIVKEWFDKDGIKYEYLTGSTKDRETVVNNFNNNESIPVFLISLKAGGTGLNLTGADYVIHYDPWWNPAVEDQATDRAHRIGQTKNVFVYKLITKGTVEEKILKLKDKKRDLADTIISAERTMEKSLTFEDLKDILSPFAD